MENTVNLMFDGVEMECTVVVDNNGEILCEAPNGRFVKFPNDDNIESAIAQHNQANSREVEIIPSIPEAPGTIHFDENGQEIIK